ncbi:MAG: hypothetical protein CL770_04030 [Chloroflexi bacterium]|nr:hypothetical protein [Chloroflexota bacterium]
MKFSVLILLIINSFFIIGCGIATSTQTGYLKQSTVNINPDTSDKYTGGNVSKQRAIKTDLPLELWNSFEYQKIAAGNSYWVTAKSEFCVFEGPGSKLSVGEKVEIIEEARCLNSQYTADDESPNRKYPVGLVKIRVLSTGQIGWTWTSSVNFD